jgi:hypothetical protein
MSDKMNNAASALADWHQVAQALADNEVEAWVKANPDMATVEPDEITVKRFNAVIEWKRQMMIAVMDETLTPSEISYIVEQGPWDDRVLNATAINTFGIGAVLADLCDLDPYKFGLYADDFAISFLKEEVMAWAQGKGSLGLGSLSPAQKCSPPERSDDLPSNLLVIGLILEALKQGRLRSPSKQNAVVVTLLERGNKNLHGISKHNLDKIFSAANKALEEEIKSLESDG